MTYLMLCFRGGALLDPIGREGLSVLCLRQLLTGTTRLSRDDFTRSVEELGSELSLVNQAHYTALSAPALTRSLPELFTLITEALCEPALLDEEVERAARTYASELESTWDDDGYLAWLWLSRRLFEGHPLYRRATLDPELIRSISAEEVRAHWSSLFHREALLPCLSGSVTRAEAEALTEALRASLPEPPPGHSLITPQALMPPLTPRAQSRLTLVHKAERRQAQVLLAQPAVPSTHPDAWALRLGVAALGGTFSSPLMQEIRVKRGLSYGTSASYRQEGACATITLNATPEGKDATETIEVMLAVLQKAKREGLSDAEVEHAKRYITNAHPFRLETPAMRASLITRATLQGVPVEQELETPTLIQGLSTEEVNEALSRHLSPERLELVALSDAEHLNALESHFSDQVGALSRVEAGDRP